VHEKSSYHIVFAAFKKFLAVFSDPPG